MARRIASLPVVDLAVAVVLVVGAVLEIGPHDPLPPWTTLVGALWAASVALRTVAPLTTAAAASLAAVGFALFPVATTPLSSFFLLLVVSFSSGLLLTGRRLGLAVVLLVGSVLAVQLLTATRPGGDTGFADVYLSPGALVAPVLGGMLLRRARRQASELRRLSRELAEEREAHAGAAAAAERTRIARELHDVIAHSVTVMVVQAAAAEQQLPAGSPLREQLLAVRQTGKDALGELRRQLGVLRDGSESSPAALPDLDRLPALAQACGARLEQDERVAASVPAGTALTAYRVVQEALTNATRHAPGASVAVRVARDDRQLVLEVLNGPTPAGPVRGPAGERSEGGHGLVGMAERVALYAGHLEAGRTEDGGWRVRALLPLEPVPVP